MTKAEFTSVIFRIAIYLLKLFIRQDKNLIVYLPLHDPSRFTGNLKAQCLKMGKATLIVPSYMSQIRDLTGEVSDVQEILIISDILISDYSSIVTDFAITKRPTIYYLYDHKAYISTNRTTYTPIEDIYPGPFVSEQNQLIDYLFNTNWYTDKEYQLRYNQFLEIFHHYFDGNSSRRIFDVIIKK